MKFNLNITDIDSTELDRVINALNVINGVTATVDADTSEIDVDMPETDTLQPTALPDVDKEGLHWDARIHSSNHKLTAKGVWQRRKGITDDEYTNVKNELLGLQPVIPFEVSAPAPQPTPQVAPDVPNPFISPSVVPPVIAPEPIPAPVVATVAPVAPQPAPAVDSVVLYQTMIDKIKNGLASQRVKANDIQNLVTAINTQFGTQYQSLAQVKDNIPATQYVINDLTAKGL